MYKRVHGPPATFGFISESEIFKEQWTQLIHVTSLSNQGAWNGCLHYNQISARKIVGLEGWVKQFT